MPRSSVRCLSLALLLACLAPPAASAAGTDGTSLFVQGGVGEEHVRMLSGGVAWALPWRSPNYGALYGVTGRLELFASGWRAPRRGGGTRTLLQVGLVPVARFHFDDGRSPWFVDAGIGVSVLDGDLQLPKRTFSTRWNFSDNLAVGRLFGAQREHEVSLHLQHTSNAGLRKPNPGLDSVMLRYAHRF